MWRPGWSRWPRPGVGAPRSIPTTARFRTRSTFSSARLYGGDGADWTDEARRQLDDLTKAGEGRVPICVAKTALSLSDDSRRLGRPTGYRVSVRRVERSAGAGFTVVFLGEIETMPGLPKRPLAERIDLLADGRITGMG